LLNHLHDHGKTFIKDLHSREYRGGGVCSEPYAPFFILVQNEDHL